MAQELLAAFTPGQRIALQPFNAADVPVPLAAAQSFNDALARAIESAPAPGILVARAELPRLFAEAQEFGQDSEVKQLLAEARADVLVIGSLVPVAGGVELTYKAFDVRTSHQIVATAPRFQAVDTSAPRGLAVAQALTSAAEQLVRQAPDMKTVETLGITYQQSDVQTPLGGYVSRELVGRLVEKISGLQSSPAALLRPQLENVTKLDAGGTEAAMVRGRAGVYLLSGTIWDFGSDVEIRLSLRGDGDRIASTGVRIRRDAIPASLLPLAPEQAVLDHRTVGGNLQLSSDRGRKPVYEIGDTANLVVQTARDGYLYCFHKASPAAGGGITKIFPNSFHLDPHVSGDTSLRIPGDDMKFVFRVEGPAGVEYVRCFATDRDISSVLPETIMRRDLQPIAVRALDELGSIFRNVPAAVSEATMVMTVDGQQ